MVKAPGVLRIAAVGLAVVAGVAAIRFGGLSGDGGAKPAYPQAEVRGANPGTTVLDLLPGDRQGFSVEERQNLFPSLMSESRSPVRPKPAAAIHSAPTFSYRYSGWVLSDGERRVYLQKGDKFISVGAGETLDGAWRVDALTEDRIELSSVPGGQKLSVALSGLVGDANAQGAAPAAAASTQLRESTLQPAATSPDVPPRQSLASAGPMLGAIGSRGAPAPLDARGDISSSEAFSPIPKQSAATGPANDSPLPTGRVGDDFPVSGSVPTGNAQGGSMPVGPAPTGLLPTSPAPTGKLGLE